MTSTRTARDPQRTRSIGTRLAVTTAISLLPATAFAASPAGAQKADPAPVELPDPARKPEDAPFQGQDYATETLRDLDGKVLSVKHFDMQGNEVTVAPDGALEPVRPRAVARGTSHEGGASSAGGCGTVELNNEYETVLGFTAFRYHTSMDWCWNRANRVVNNVSYDSWLTNMESTFYWRGELQHRAYDYEYVSGYKSSGHISDRTGQVENCVINQGCINMNYPRNIIRGHHDGTWTGWTS